MRVLSRIAYQGQILSHILLEGLPFYRLLQMWVLVHNWNYEYQNMGPVVSFTLIAEY